MLDQKDPCEVHLKMSLKQKNKNAGHTGEQDCARCVLNHRGHADGRADGKRADGGMGHGREGAKAMNYDRGMRA